MTAVTIVLLCYQSPFIAVMSQVSFSPSAFFSCPAASDVDSGTSQVDSCLDCPWGIIC